MLLAPVAPPGRGVLVGVTGTLISIAADLRFRTVQPGTLGGIDTISGNAADDVLIGGTAGDVMYGDDAAASAGDADGEDIMLGDNADIFLAGHVGRLKVRVAGMLLGTAVDLITTTDNVDENDPDYDTREEAEAVGGADTMSGNAKADIMLGGVNADDGVGDPEVDLEFVVTHPGLFFPDYAPEIDDDTANRLELESADDALLLVIVTVTEPVAASTANLLGPIVVNRHTRAAAQAVLGASGYNTREALVSSPTG